MARTVLPNLKAYDAAGKGTHSLFSAEHCCVCGLKVEEHCEWLLLTRAVDGGVEYAISHPLDARPAERKLNLWVAPIGRSCLRKYKSLRHAVLRREVRRG